MSFIEREGGVTLADIGTDNLLDAEAVSDAELIVRSQSLSNGEVRRLSGSVRAELTLDRTDPEAFDVDVDGDGASDYRRIRASVRAGFAGARGCASLGEGVPAAD